MIDIVVPFYNDNDEIWRNIMHNYMEKEGSNDRQVTGEERYRDWDCFKYFFRCVENNCKWVNKVFLLLASETQLPEWIDTSNTKLRVVYHREFIPEELLPTFNTMTIETYICKIKDLSDNYIYCNDDYYFLNPTTSDMFFKDNIPVYKNFSRKLEKYPEKYLKCSDGTFYRVLNNGMDFQLEICGNKAKWYEIDHIPVPHKKDFESIIIDQHYDTFLNANLISKFRNGKNFSNHVFVCLYKDMYKFNENNNLDSHYLIIRKDTDFDEYKNFTMVCFNDTEQLKKEDFLEVKKRMVNFFENKFPNKSSYEK